MAWFQKYVHSPFFNAHADIISLVEYLHKQHPDFSEKACHREVIFKKVFPNKPFDIKKLKHLFSFTIALAEDYLVVAKFKERNNYGKLLLLDALSNKDLDARYQRHLKKVQRTAENIEAKDQDFFYEQYLLSKMVNNHHYSETNRNIDAMLGEVDKNLDIFYLSEKLRNACNIASREITFKSTVEYPLIKDLLHYVEQNKSYFEDHPLVSIYFMIYQTLTEKEDKAFFIHLIQELNEKSKGLSMEVQSSMYGFCVSYCVKQINRGHSDYLQLIFDLYKSMLEKGLLLEGGLLTEWRYKNLVTVGCRLKDFKWTENFIHEFKPKLNKKVRENAFNYNLAYFHYAVKNMDEALEILNNVKFTDLVYILDSRGLILRIYFDKDEEETMNYQIESFQSYLKRNKSISDQVRKRYTNLLRYLRKLARLRSNLEFKRDKELVDDLNDLKVNIHANRQEIANPSWFRGKIEELQEKYTVK